jgi:hypothetical protein
MGKKEGGYSPKGSFALYIRASCWPICFIKNELALPFRRLFL